MAARRKAHRKTRQLVAKPVGLPQAREARAAAWALDEQHTELLRKAAEAGKRGEVLTLSQALARLR